MWVPSWACLLTGHGLPAATGPRPPPEPMDAKPPTHRRRGRAEEATAARPRHRSPHWPAPTGTPAPAGSRPPRPCAINSAITVAFPIARTPPACPAGMRSEPENLRVCGLRDRPSNTCKYSAGVPAGGERPRAALTFRGRPPGARLAVMRENRSAKPEARGQRISGHVTTAGPIYR